MGCRSSKPSGEPQAMRSASSVVTAIPVACIGDALPMTPMDDRNGRFDWTKCQDIGNEILELQEKGFVIATEAENGYSWLRRRRFDPSEHRFATATSVKVQDRVLALGACRTGPKHITRDVCDSSGASLTMVVPDDGIETYVFNGGSVSVSFVIE